MTARTRPNGRVDIGDLGEADLHGRDARCPYCDGPVTRKKYREIIARIESEGHERIKNIEAELGARFAREQQQAASKAKADVTAQLAKAKQDAAAALAGKVAEAINAEKARGYAERLKLTEQLQDLQRRLEKRTANDLGDEGELDALELLTKAFPDDQINRTKKFSAGGDIVHRIMKGTCVGVILYDTKNTRVFQSKWPAKLKQDMLDFEDQTGEAVAHGVLVTASFPAGSRDVAVRDEILLVSPSRLIPIATWLRLQVIRTASLTLSNRDRLDKAGRLYRFMCSEKVRDRWSRMEQTINRMRDTLRTERQAHERVFGDRADQLDLLSAIRADFVGDLHAIFEATASEDLS